MTGPVLMSTDEPNLRTVQAQRRISWWALASVAVAAAIPMLRILANNPGEDLDLNRLVMWWAVFSAIGAVLVLVASRVDAPGSPRLQATAVAVALLVFFYGPALAKSLGFEAAWMSIAVTAAPVIAAGLASRPRSVQHLLVILPFFLAVAPIVDMVGGARAEPVAEAEAVEEAMEPFDFPPIPADNRPNVYWFILDGHPRSDVMAELGADYDLADELAGLGLEVDQEAVAPYSWTHLSISSTVAGNYLPNDVTYDDLHLISQKVMFENPTVLSWFDDAGYRRLVLPAAGWSGWTCGQPDSICLSGGPLHVEDDLVYSVTLLGPVLDLVVAEDDKVQVVDPVPAVDRALRIRSQEADRDQPFFALFHVMSPHPPYRWLGPDCTPQLAHLAEENWLPDQDLLDAVRCTGERATEAVRRILEADPSALVIVQGDHGARIKEEHWSQVGTDMDVETVWLAPLLAMKTPDGCELGQGNNTVNVFRIVARCLTGEDVGLLPSKSWEFPSEDSPPTPVTP